MTIAREAPATAALVARLRAAGCVFAEDEAALLADAAGSPDELAALVQRRLDGVPLEVVVGWAAFCGLRIAVEPGVFVPRRRTEPLARAAAVEAKAHGRPQPVVVDLCCGSGAIGAVVAALVPGVTLYAVDIDPAAVRCALRNLAPYAGQVHLGDLFEPLPVELRGAVDVVVVNAPYVPTAEIELMPVEARVHEPRVALDGGTDGLEVHRRVARAADEWLAPDGALLAECGERQVAGLLDVFAEAGLSTSVARGGDGELVVAGRRGGRA
jgi:release factor glutamine methyltransferase